MATIRITNRLQNYQITNLSINKLGNGRTTSLATRFVSVSVRGSPVCRSGMMADNERWNVPDLPPLAQQGQQVSWRRTGSRIS
jgi:hypothetical protein